MLLVCSTIFGTSPLDKYRNEITITLALTNKDLDISMFSHRRCRYSRSSSGRLQMRAGLFLEGTQTSPDSTTRCVQVCFLYCLKTCAWVGYIVGPTSGACLNPYLGIIWPYSWTLFWHSQPIAFSMPSFVFECAVEMIRATHKEPSVFEEPTGLCLRKYSLESNAMWWCYVRRKNLQPKRWRVGNCSVAKIIFVVWLKRQRTRWVAVYSFGFPTDPTVIYSYCCAGCFLIVYASKVNFPAS